MILICAWCRRYLGTKEPHHMPALTHGICGLCMDRLRWAEAFPGRQAEHQPTLVIGRSRGSLLPLFQELLKPVPEIRIVVDRRQGERRQSPPPLEATPTRGCDRRRGLSLALV